MFRIDHPTAAAALPAPLTPGTPGYFTRGNPTAGQPSTVVTADWANAVQEEIMSVLALAGISPNKAQQNQLAQAISAIVASGGTPNASAVAIADAGSHFESGNVEGALQELGDTVNFLVQTQGSLGGVVVLTASASLSTGHINRLVEFNSETPVNYTITLGVLNLLQIGDTVHICQAGDGKVTVVPDEGVTVKKGDSFNRATMEREAIIVLVKTAEGIARLGGALEAVA